MAMFWKSEPKVSTDDLKIEQLLVRSVAEILPSAESLRSLLKSGRQLRVKLGIDPTSPNLHIGRAVTILKLKDFQDLGHKIVFIIGDATGVVGDTSDKESERPMLTAEQVQTNLTSYVEQMHKLLRPELMEVRRNSEWLLKLNYADIGEQADQFSVADFIARENIKRRLDAGKRVSLREVLYPLMQGYDSVAVKADVELGGTDQKFNLLAGRSLQGKFGQPPQNILMTEIIPGTDGRKMSSSWGNTINLNDAPNDMFGKVMSIPDTIMMHYFTHTTRLPIERTQELLRLENPRDAKLELASEIVSMYHGIDASREARRNFENTFSKGEIPDHVEVIHKKGLLTVLDVLVQNKVVSSNSELRRLVEQGAVTNLTLKKKILNFNEAAEEGIYRIGKHRFVKII